MTRFFSVCLMIFLWSSLALPAQAEQFPFGQCHIEKMPVQRIYATLKLDFETDSAFAAREWVAYVCVPPVLCGQKDISVTLSAPGAKTSCATISEHSLLQRKLIAVRTYGDGGFEQKLPLEAHFWGTLFRRRLLPGSGGEVEKPSGAEWRNCLAESETIDFKSFDFQSFLDRQGLRLRTGERDIDFAFRVFEKIRQIYSYKFQSGQDRRVSALCHVGETDCGGLSFLFVGALRANDIPARPLVGRWAKSDNAQDDAAGYGQCHVKSEFYAADIGWVPVEMSGAVSHKDGKALNFFGVDNGDFLTLHQGTDLVIDSLFFGPKTIYVLQEFALWVTGTGSYSQRSRVLRWTVVSDAIGSGLAGP